MPEEPVAHFWKVNLLDSSSSGLWSETIISIVPFLTPLIKSSLSCSVLKGGDNFKKVLNSPISFSLSDKWLIETPVVKSTFFDFHSFIISNDFPDDSRAIWYLDLYWLSNLKSLSITTCSA